MKRTIGIMGAMPEEIDGIVELMVNVEQQTIGKRIYYTGTLNGVKTVVVFSRWGKVAAATTVTTLILQFGITELLFLGVAGAIHPDINIGDIVLAKRLVQHDMDARPLMKQYEIPLLEQSFFHTDDQTNSIISTTINSLFEHNHLLKVIGETEMERFTLSQPKLYIGDIASGDQFFSGDAQKENLLKGLPSVLCVEMEGAAVAQVCFEYQIPFSIVRTISDSADQHAPIDFPLFIKEISSKYAVEIVKGMYANGY